MPESASCSAVSRSSQLKRARSLVAYLERIVVARFGEYVGVSAKNSLVNLELLAAATNLEICVVAIVPHSTVLISSEFGDMSDMLTPGGLSRRYGP